jgi:hypothetical protein
MGIPASKILGLAGLLATKSNKVNAFQPRSPFIIRPPMLWSRCLNGGLSSVLDTSGSGRQQFTAWSACHEPQAVFANYQTSTGEIPSPNSIQVSGTIEYPANIFHRLTFGGKQSVTIDPYAYIQSDPVSINIPAGANCWVRTFVSIQAAPVAAPTLTTAGAGGTLAAATYFYKWTTVGATGESGPSPEASIATALNGTNTLTLGNITQAHTSIKVYRSTATGTEVYLATLPPNTYSWTDTGAIAAGSATPPAVQRFPIGPGFAAPARPGEGLNYPSVAAGAGTDQTATVGTAWFSGTNNVGYGAMALNITPDAGFNTAVVGLIGDSIMSGSNDLNDRGFAARALISANLPYHYFGRGGETAQAISPLTGNTGFKSRIVRLEACTDAISNYGTNDLNGGRTLAQLQADLLAIWTMLQTRGVRVYQTTILPRTTSSDNWATAPNQTVPAWEASRVSLNTWLRDPSAAGAVAQSGGALLGIFDTAATVEVNSANVITLNGGRWLTNGTGTAYCDNLGTHPSQLSTALMAVAINTSLFTPI